MIRPSRLVMRRAILRERSEELFRRSQNAIAMSQKANMKGAKPLKLPKLTVKALNCR